MLKIIPTDILKIITEKNFMIYNLRLCVLGYKFSP